MGNFSYVLVHGLLIEPDIVAQHALTFLDHGGEHGSQFVPLLLAEARQLTKAKDTAVLGLAILVDVRLRETVVVVADCRTVPLVAIFLCLGYIHNGSKSTHMFQRGQTGGCSILGVTKEQWVILKIFIQNMG